MFVLFFKMNTEVKNDLRRRRQIYELISKNPGLHMRDISRKMDIPLSSLEYHLNYLKKRSLIISKKDSKYNRYFISLEIGEEEKKILSFLRKRTTLHILLWFIIAVQCTQKDLGKFLDKHPATIAFHLKRMEKAGIIETVSSNNGVIKKKTLPSTIKRTQVTSEKIYVLKDQWMIYDLIVKHKKSLADKQIVDGFIEYVEFYISDGIPEQVKNKEDTLDSIVDTFNSFFFPPPFCS